MKILDYCRYCGSKELDNILDLGKMPLVNNLLDSEDSPDPKFPLKLVKCVACEMAQITYVVDPEILYSNYRYRSGMSAEFKHHCQELAYEISFMFEDGYVPTIISIAENDGTFLQNFKEFNETYECEQYKFLGVEPATNLCKIMDKNKIPNVNKFFSYQTALDIATKYEADVIVAQNVFAHVDDIHNFMNGVVRLLKPTGTFIVEVPWQHKTLVTCDIGQAYHEHLGYISLGGMVHLMTNYGLHVSDCEYFDIHGGTLRFYITKTPPTDQRAKIRIIGIRALEEERNDLHYVEREGRSWAVSKMQKDAYELKDKVTELVSKNKTVYGIGASAKGCILLNYAGITTSQMPRIYDNTPEKIGKFQPGTKIPIIDFAKIAELKNDDTKFLILSHNWQDEMIKNVRRLKPDAKFIVTHPEVKEI